MMKGFDTMKMKKLLACACLATASLVLPCRADDDYTCVTNGFSFNYSLNTDGKVVIHNNNGTLFNGEELVIPAQLDGIPVASLGAKSFMDRLTSRGRAFIENGPQEIGSRAFYSGVGMGWDVVCVPGSVTKFSGAFCLELVGKVYWTISSETLSIDDYAFGGGAPWELQIVATCGVPNELHDKFNWESFGYYRYRPTSSPMYWGQTYYKCKKAHFDAWVERGGLDRFRGYVADDYEYGKAAVVSFNVNGGKPLPDGTYRQGSPYASLPTPTPIRLGYSFGGWRTAPYPEAGQEDGFAVGVDDVVAAPRETLYATWTPLKPTWTVEGTTVTYDGLAHGITVCPTAPVDDVIVTYAESEMGPYADASPTLTEAGTKQIWYMLKAPDWAPLTNSATLKVVKLVSDATVAKSLSPDSYVYSGAANQPSVMLNDTMAQPNLTVTAYAAGDVDGDGVLSENDVTLITKYNAYQKLSDENKEKFPSYNLTGEALTAADVNKDGVVDDGDVTALRAKFIVYELVEGTDYSILYSDNVNAGTGRVTITGKGNYSGSTVLEFTINKATLGESGEPGSGTMPSGGKSKYDMTYVYDGKGHTVNTNALSSLRVNGAAFEIAYSLDGATDWQTAPIVYTNAGQYVIWYRLQNANYNDYVHEAQLTITPKPISDSSITMALAPDKFVPDSADTTPKEVIIDESVFRWHFVEPYSRGDVDGDGVLLQNDADVIDRHVAYLEMDDALKPLFEEYALTGKALSAADYNDDGVVDATDVSDLVASFVTLLKGVDYTIAYKAGVRPLTATAIVTGLGNYGSSLMLLRDEWGCHTVRLFVDADNGNDSNDGTSWEKAKKSIQAAVDVSEDSDTILVADGTYEPITTANKKITIRSVNGADKTFIDGGGTNRCAYLGGSTNQVDTTLMGFTLKDGYLPSSAGAGVSGGFVRNCVITNCLVNLLRGFGGGASGAILEECILINNQALHGGGCIDSIARRCQIIGNYAHDDGGGAISSQVFDTVLTRNRSWNLGGNLSGTALSSCLAYNCTVVSNVANAGAVAKSTLRNCIVFGNLTGGGVADDFRDNHEGTNRLFSCWTNSVAFVDAANGNFRLNGLIDEKLDSHPCVNTGDNGAVVSEKDLSGNMRIFDSVVDMGAYEFRGCTYKLKNYEGACDGVGHTIQVTPSCPSEASVSYSLSPEGPYSSEEILISDLCEPTKIWFTVAAEGYETVTNFGTVAISGVDLSATTVELSETAFVYDGQPKRPAVRINGVVPADGVCQIDYENNTNAGTASVTIKGVDGFVGEVSKSFTISPRPVTLTSGTKTDFVYDGTAHEFSVLAKSGNGFVAGEGITTSNWAKVTTVAQGQVANAFDYAPIEGTVLANYEISVVTGKIAVVRGSFEPDGGGEPGGGDVPDGGLSKFDAAAVVYNGEGHTIDTNALVAAFNAAMAGAGETVFAYGYAADDATATGQETGGNLASGADAATGAEDVAEWREIAPAFTNAGEYVVWYRVTNPNYEDFVHAAKVTISPRPVTLTSGTKTDFVYDGTAHEFPVLAKSENGFVAGEGITTSNWATVTTVAQDQVANTFSYEADENTDLANYEISIVTGKIAVVAASIPVGPTGAITAVGYTNVYDDATHGVSVAATGLLTEPTVQYRASEADEWTDASPTFSNVCDTQVWWKVSAPNYADATGTIGVKITPRPVRVTVKGKTATFAYDTTEKSVSGYNVATEDDLYDVDEDTRFVGDETAATAARTDVGTTAMGLSVSDFRNGNVNFDVTYAVTDGGVTVTPRVIGDDPANWDIRLAKNPMYDGAEKSAPITQVAFVKPDGNLDYISYELSGNTATDAGNYVVRITGKGNYSGTVEKAWAITPRNITLTSGGATWVYDGAAHSEKTVSVGGDGFVSGEGAAYSGFPEVRHVADAAEPIANAFSYAFNANTKARNYEVTTRTGMVQMTPRAVTLTAPTKEKPYDGAPLTFGAEEIEISETGHAGRMTLPNDEAFTFGNFSSLTEAGRVAATFTVADGTALMSDYALTVVPGTLTVTKSAAQITVTAKSGTWVYDGQPHALHEYEATNIAVLQSGDVLDVTFDEASVVTTPTDGAARDGVVENAIASVRVMRGDVDVTANYTVASYNGTLTVTKRPVTLTSKSASKAYDGTPLTAREVTIGGDGFVGDDGAEFTYTGAQTDKGTSKNTFAYALKDGTRAENYAITKIEGDLEVTAADISDGDDADWQIVLGPSLTYTGLEQIQTLASVTYKGLPLDFFVSGNAQTDARTYRMTLTGQGNFTGEHEVEWRIAPKPLTLTAKSASKTYDGTALTVDGATAEGFVSGEGAEYECDGLQTDVGSSENNVASINWSANTKGSNYAVTKLPGTLSVTPRPVTLTAKSLSKPYDGTPLTLTEADITADGLVAGESFVFSGFASRTEAGQSPATFAYAAGAGTKLANYAVTVTPGATITITKSATAISVTAASQSWVYDGESHSNRTWTATNCDTLQPGDALEVTFDDASVVTTPQDGAARDGVVENSITAVRVIRDGTEDVTANYTVEWFPGTLTVTKRPVTVKVVGKTATFTYDGDEKSVEGYDLSTDDELYDIDADTAFSGTAEATRTDAGKTEMGLTSENFTNGNECFDVTYAVTDGWVKVDPLDIAAAGDGFVLELGANPMYNGIVQSVAVESVTCNDLPVTYTLAGENATHAGTYTLTVKGNGNFAGERSTTWKVLKREVTLTSGGASKAYDGVPLTCGEVSVSGDGFIGLEGATYEVTGSQTAAGSSKNTFAYALKAGTLADDYEITTVEGDLVVTKATHDGDGEEPGGGDVPDGGLSKFDAAAVVYNGEGHTIDTNALVAAFNAAMAGAGETVFAYALDDGTGASGGAGRAALPWEDSAPAFTNAGEYVVWYRVTNPNYEDFAHAAKVTITKRPVTLTSGTKTDFVYDGSPHEFPVLAKSENGFVAGEGITTSDWATVTTVAQGQVANTFSYEADENTDLANYEISIVTGKIAVVAASIPVGPTGAITAVGYTNVYDGATHGVSVAATGLLTEPTVQYKASEGDEWQDESPAYADVCDTQVWWKVSAPNYADATGTIGVKITPRPVTVKVKGKTATYAFDGEEKSVCGYDISTEDALYDATENTTFRGEAVAADKPTISRTDVGMTAMNLKPADFANGNANFEVTYEVVSDGSLTVTLGAIVFGAQDYEAEYDGDGHSVAVDVTAPAGLVPKYALAKDGPYSADAPMFTNVCSDVVVWFALEADQYAAVTNSATVTIKKRPLAEATLAAIPDQVYTGSEIKPPLSFADAGSRKVTENDYTVDYSDNVRVGTATVTITATNGGNYSGEVIAHFNINKATHEGGGEEPGGGDVPDGGLSKFDAAAVVYDGDGHTIDTNALVVAFNAAMAGAGETRFEYGYATAGAAATGQETGGNLASGAGAATGAEDVTEWREIAPAFTNAGEYVVWYRVTNPNYEDFVHAAKVTITPRPVTLTSGTKLDFVYDGTTHEFPVLAKSENGFVTGEGITTSNWATVTTVAEGQVANTFDYAPIEGTVLANYEISVVTGKIAVVAAPPSEPEYAALAGTLAWKLNLATGCYTSQLKLTCTNGFENGISDLRFVYQDRMDGANVASCLWDSSARTKRPTVTLGGVEYRAVALDAARLTAQGATAVYGVRDVSQPLGTVASAECEIELYVRNLAKPVSDIAYITWKSNGAQCSLPISAAGGSQGMTVSGTMLGAVRLASSASRLAAPLSTEALSRSLAVGVVLDEASSPYCRLADFSVADGVVRGRVEVGKVASGVETQGALGANARVVLLGAASLDGGFAELGGAAVAEDGAFRFDLGDAEARFFKVRIDVQNVVE